MMKTKIYLLLVYVFSTCYLNAQSVINQIMTGEIFTDSINAPNIEGCGSFEYMKFLNKKVPGYLDASNDFMRQVKEIIAIQKGKHTPDEIMEIPVVFHVVYNIDAENIHDSVLHNQIQILNDCYRRKNSDTINLRPAFANMVGDAKIQFKLAEVDPDGNPTTGITRTNTPITNFGGILPYGQGQNQEISNWVNDSLYYNWFRLTKDSLGGKNAWDVNHYLNIWIGDLRILEPQFNNFEEIVFFGLATPPQEEHLHWPDSLMQGFSSFEQGVLMHYVNIGSNNPNLLPSPYNTYNGKVTKGKLLVHEIGHYLGLRHIWGDGDCSVDDFIDDTPNCSSSGQWSCNKTRNTCIDSINGVNLPDMVENYMDYSSHNCQNAFTLGQIDFMRYVLNTHRPELINTSTPESKFETNIQLYPNPTTGIINVEMKSDNADVVISVRDLLGQLVMQKHFLNSQNISFEIEKSSGIYFVEIISKDKHFLYKLIKQ